MQVKKLLKKLIVYEPPKREPFILPEGNWWQEAERGGALPQGKTPPIGADTDTKSDEVAAKLSAQTGKNIQPPERQMRKPTPLKELLAPDDGHLSANLNVNHQTLCSLFHKPENIDLVIREFALPSAQKGAMLVYIDGIVDSDRLNYTVLEPLMVLAKCWGEPDRPINLDVVREHLMPIHQVGVVDTWEKVVFSLVDGLGLLFLDGDARALTMESRNFPTRSISKPEIESVVQGPQEAFTESKRSNAALVRKHVRDRNLVTEAVDLGESQTGFLMYINGTASPLLVAEVRRRLENFAGEFTRESGHIAQMIEEYPNSLFPQLVTTERPDRVAIQLLQGKVAVVFDGSPFAIICPATLFTLIQTPEDTYLRPAFGTLLRLVRVTAIFIAYLLPGLYLAVVMHHAAIIPPDLLLAVAGAREGVPFPSWLEVLLMEVSFEVIREAGIRVPGVIGPTIGIVGAIVLGQAAVSAAIVSPALIIVVAVTALAAFAIPNYQLQFSTRIIRFAYIVIGYALGLFGIVIGLAFQLVYTTGLTAFGVGYLSPVAPATKRDKDVVFRTALYTQETRPDYLQPSSRVKQPQKSRPWLEDDNSGKE